MCNENIYRENGYADRSEYLASLSDEYDTDPMIVNTVADLLGEKEDFDGLISALEDVNYLM